MATTASKVPGRRWTIGVLLGVGVLINYIDRINLSVAAPQLQQDFHLSPEEIGLLFSAFFWSYSLLQVPGGMVLDRFGVTPGRALGRVSLGRGIGDHRPLQRIRRHLCRPGAARRRGGARLPGEPEGHRLLVPPQRAGAVDRHFRLGGEVLQRHRRAAGGVRHRQSGLALGLRDHRPTQSCVFRRLLFDLSRSERASEAEQGGTRLHPRRRRHAGRLAGRRQQRDVGIFAAQQESLGADHRLLRLRLFLLSVPDLAARLHGPDPAHEHPEIGRFCDHPLDFRQSVRFTDRWLPGRLSDRARLR